MAAGGHRVDHRDTGEVWLGDEKVEDDGDSRADPVGPILNRGDGLGDQVVEMVDDDVERGQEAVLLGLEVLIEGAPRDPCRLDDFGDRDLAVGAFAGELDQGGDQPLALVVGDLLAGKAVGPRRQRPQLRFRLSGHGEDNMYL